MQVIIFGATGMIGAGVLRECLADARVAHVLAVGRSTTGVTHAKLRELTRTSFFDFDDVAADLTGYDACFFCLGVSSAGMSEADYQRVTHDMTLAAARAVGDRNDGITFCYISGEGADSSERGRVMWARVKGRTENALFALPNVRAFSFRPGYVQPRHGIRSRTPLYRLFYALFGPLYPVLRRVAPSHVTTTDNVGRAMIAVAAGSAAPRVLENRDINRIAEADRRGG